MSASQSGVGRAVAVAVVGAVSLFTIGGVRRLSGAAAVVAGEPAIVFVGPDRLMQLCSGPFVGTSATCRVVGDPFLAAEDAELGDLDGDGAAEIVLVYGGDVYACAPDGRTSPTCTALVTRPVVHDVRALALGDLDGDGAPEAVLARYSEAPVVCFGRLGPGFECRTLADAGSFGRDVALADVDGDGDLDVAVAGYRPGESAAQLCWNDGRGDLACRALAPSDVVVAAMRLGDVDGDGGVDALVSLHDRRGYVLCSGRPDMAFDCLPIDLGADDPPGPTPMVSVVRGAGGAQPELVVAGWSTRLCRADAVDASGAVRFECRRDAFDGLGSRTVAAVDLDGDGIDEIVLGGPNRVCRREITGSFACSPIGDPEANARLVAVAAVSPPPRPTPATPAATRAAAPPVTPWPPRSPTAMPTEVVPGARAMDSVTLVQHGRLALPAEVRDLRVDGARAVAFGGQCGPEPESNCRASAVLIDLSTTDRPRTQGVYEPREIDETILDTQLHGGALYVIVERRSADGGTAARPRLVVVDVTDPARPGVVSESDLGTPLGGRYPEPEHGGLARIGSRLVWGTSSGLRVFDVTEPLDPRLVARLAIPSAALGISGSWLLVAEPEDTLRIVDFAEPALPRDLGNVQVTADGRSLDSLVGVSGAHNRAYVTLRLTCSDPGPPQFPPGREYPCGSGLAAVRLAGPPEGPRITWTGLFTWEHGLGAALWVDDMLLVAQGRLVALDPLRADHPVLAEIERTRVDDGVRRIARPYDLARAGGRVLVLERVSDDLPAELRVLEVLRSRRVFLPRAVRGR